MDDISSSRRISTNFSNSQLARLSCCAWSGYLVSVYACLTHHYVTLRFNLTADWLILSFFSLGLYFFYAIAKVYRRVISGLQEELSMVCKLHLEVSLAIFRLYGEAPLQANGNVEMQ